MAFPYNVDPNTLNTFVAMVVSMSGFLVGTASFLTGRYLSEWENLVPVGRLRIYVTLICSLLILPTIALAFTEALILLSCQSIGVKTYLTLIVLAPLVPIMAIVAIIVRKILGG